MGGDAESTCEMKFCENDAEFRLHYVEPGTPHRTKIVCSYHQDFELIHDPENIESEPL